jgi:hypothetical protein
MSAKPNGTNPPPTAPAVGGLFFPQTKSLGIDRTELSPTLQRKIVRAGTQSRSFAQGSEELADYLHFEIDAKQVERVTKRIGTERCAQRDADTQEYVDLPLAQRKAKPAHVVAPDVAVVSVDGGRLQIRDTPAPKTAAANAEESVPPDDKHHGTHWREDKIGLLMTMLSTEQASDPCPQVPAVFIDPTRITKLARELKTKKSAQTAASAPEVAGAAEEPAEVEQVLRDEGKPVGWEPPEVKDKYLAGTRRPWAEFGPMMAEKAWQLGFFVAARRAFVGDGSGHVWSVWRSHFSSFEAILDIIHAISYLFAGATAGRPFAVGWTCYVRWIGWVWQGEVAKVIVELAERQAELGVPPDDAGETDPRVVVSTALGYLQTHKDKMRYAEYRRRGLPITSSYVESAVKQFNERVKGTEKFWTEAGAEALLQLRADYLGTTTVLDEFWEARQDNATGQNAYAQAA